MAKRRGRRKFRKYLKGQIENVVSIADFPAKSAASDPVDDTVTEKAWLSSVQASWSLTGATPTANAGPIWCGIAHSDYTTAEIEEWIENTQSWEEGDKRQQEVARRFIRDVGTFPTPQDAVDKVVLNDGKPIRTKCGWMLASGQTVRMWIYNTGTIAFATTTVLVKAQGHANLWPA